MPVEGGDGGMFIIPTLAMLIGVAGLTSCLWRSWPHLVPRSVLRWAALMYLCVLGPWFLHAHTQTMVMAILGCVGTALAFGIYLVSEPGEDWPLGPRGP